MPDRCDNTHAVIPAVELVSTKKAYATPLLRDLDKLEQTEGGINPGPLESTNGMMTS